MSALRKGVNEEGTIIRNMDSTLRAEGRPITYFYGGSDWGPGMFTLVAMVQTDLEAR